MPDIPDLLRDKKLIDAELAARKTDAVAAVIATISQLGLTWADLGVAPIKTVAHRPVKFRDEVGNTWTGVGQRPRWLRARLLMGHDLEQFRVKKGG